MIAFAVHGLPRPQGSKTIRSAGDKTWTTESSKALPEWRRAVQQRAGDAMHGRSPLDGTPVALDVRFHLPRPQAHYGTGRNAARLKSSAPARPTTMPDLDKLVRAVCDALTNVAWRTDAQVTVIHAAKLYATGTVGCDVIIRTLDNHADGC